MITLGAIELGNTIHILESNNNILLRCENCHKDVEVLFQYWDDWGQDDVTMKELCLDCWNNQNY